MSRFRVSGFNWEPRAWYLAPCLVTLARQIETAYPEPQPGDGTVASKRHDEISPNSDHRPRPFTGPGIVRAIDTGETSETATQELVNAIVAGRDPRMMYLIYEGRSIWSVPHNGFPAWTWQPYGGPNPHNTHFHLSSVRDSRHDNNTAPWQIGVDVMTPEQEAKLDAVLEGLRTLQETTGGIPNAVHSRPIDDPYFDDNPQFATFVRRIYLKATTAQRNTAKILNILQSLAVHEGMTEAEFVAALEAAIDEVEG